MSPVIKTIDTIMPAEQVVLNAPLFAPKGGMLDKFHALGSDVEVSKKQLAQIAYAAAFLAAEDSGSIRLEIRSKKALLGLRSVQTLYADPTSGSNPWPSSSIEGQLQPLAERLQAKKNQNEVGLMVYSLFSEDVLSPYDFALGMIHASLAGRGLLEVHEEKKLKIFTTRRYELPEQTAQAARECLAQAQQLLAACQNGRPDVWKMLLFQINDGIQRRTKQQDGVTGDY